MEEKRSIKTRFVSNTAWMMAQKIYSMIVSLIVGSLSARYLGPSNYGLLNYGTSIIAFFTTVSALGLNNVLVAEMVRSPEKQGKYLGTSIFMRFIASVLSFIGIFCVISILEPGNRLVLVVTMLQAIAVVLNSYEVFLYWFQLKLAMKYVSIASMIGLTVTSIWRISLLITGQSVEFFALTSSISALVVGSLVIVFFLKSEHPKLKISLPDGRFLVQNSYHFIISGLAVTLYSQIDRVMLGKWVSTEAVGFYSAAAAIAVMWEFIPLALIDSARPLIMEKIKNNGKEYLEKYRVLLLSVTLLGVAFSVFIMLFGKLAIWILYGEKYFDAVPVMQILVWSTCFAIIGSARSIWIVGERKNKYSKYYVIIGAVVNLVLNAIFIPIWGIVAAAATTLISQIVVALIAPLLFKETKEFVSIYLTSFKSFPQLKQLAIEGMRKRKKG